MNIYQLIVVNPKYDRRETAQLFTVPHRLFATLMGAVDHVMDDANKDRRDLWDYLHGSTPPIPLVCRPVGFIEWDIDVPDAPDAPDSPAPVAWVTYSWTDPETGIAYHIHECEVGK